MIAQCKYLTLLIKQHASQARDHDIAEESGLPLVGLWRPYAWGIGWRRWFFGLIVYLRVADVREKGEG